MEGRTNQIAQEDLIRLIREAVRESVVQQTKNEAVVLQDSSGCRVELASTCEDVNRLSLKAQSLLRDLKNPPNKTQPNYTE